VNRRELITLLGCTAAVWPLAARAQQPAMPVIGLLHDGSFEPRAHHVAAFGRGLAEAGFVEGRDVLIEYHWAQDQSDRLPALVAQVVQRNVAVIATPGSPRAALAVKAATNAIPIVFSIGADPVKLGLVASLNRPGGNATGVSYFSNELGPKRLGLLLELMAGGADIVMLANPKNATTDFAVQEVNAAATAAGRQFSVLLVSSNREIDAAFATMVQKRAPAFLIHADELLFSRRVQLVTLATRHAVPAIYTSREYTEIGGLMSYGVNLFEIWRQVGSYVGRILKGTKPADLPVVQPTRFEFVINLQTAKALGLEIPPTLLARADEVIE
jgi:putative ABC transport system substrate-binding protein